jgi:hypothetical protein
MWDEIGVGFCTAWGLEDLYSTAYVFEGDYTLVYPSIMTP